LYRSEQAVYGDMLSYLTLDHFIDDAIDYDKRVEVKILALACTFRNLLVLLVEIVEKGRTVVTAITLSGQIELCGLDLRIKLR